MSILQFHFSLLALILLQLKHHILNGIGSMINANCFGELLSTFKKLVRTLVSADAGEEFWVNMETVSSCN